VGYTERLLHLIRNDVETRFGEAVFRRALDASVHQQQPRPARWSFAVDYALHVRTAVREYADLLTQAVIARQKKITRKAGLTIVDETLKFASELTSWEGCAGTYVAISLGITGKDAASSVDISSRMAFAHEVEQFLFNWRIEANNAITLRCFLSARSQTPLTSTDLIKPMIARIKVNNPKFSQQQICARLDALKIPLPTKLQRAGVRTWVDAYNNYKGAVKVFLSKIKPSPSKPSS
jgi:hypothetical protein